MHDFVSPFWGWFILIGTLGSIAALTWFVWHFSSKRGAELEMPESDQPQTMGHTWDGDLAEFNNPLPMWWLKLFYYTLAFGVIYLFLFPGLGAFQGVLGWSSWGQYDKAMERAEEEYGPIFARYLSQDLAQVATDPDAHAIGASLYATYCTTCHGSDAGGAIGYPNLRDDDWLYGGEPETIKTSILNGRQGLMPAWAEILDEQQVADVTEYIISLSGRAAKDDAKVRGQEVFMGNCAACHGAEGLGNPLMGAPNLTDNTWLYGSSIARIKESINAGRQGVMPAHGEFLGEAKVHLLAAYIYSLTASSAPVESAEVEDEAKDNLALNSAGQ